MPTPVASSSTPSSYWIIVSDEGTSTKPRKHTTYQSAYDESIRLSQLKPGINFTVYQMIGTAYTEKPAEPKTKYTAFAPQVIYDRVSKYPWDNKYGW